jgi:hypothetical protein
MLRLGSIFGKPKTMGELQRIGLVEVCGGYKALTQWRLTAKGAALASSLAVVLALAGCAQPPASPVELVRPGYAPAYPPYDPPDERAEAASKLCRPMPPGVGR